MVGAARCGWRGFWWLRARLARPDTGHPAWQVVDRYFVALRDRDYATAFASLGAGAAGPDGAPATYEDFLQRQRSVEDGAGPVTAHEPVNHASSAGLWNYTVRVTRGQRTEAVFPYVEKVDGAWRIVRFGPGHMNPH